MGMNKQELIRLIRQHEEPDFLLEMETISPLHTFSKKELEAWLEDLYEQQTFNRMLIHSNQCTKLLKD